MITTPESLFLMLTSQAREALRGVETVILDEVHAVAGTKRGAHLALSLERLDELLARPAQRIGLSATVRPLDEVARFLGGQAPVEVVAPPSEKRWDLTVVVPVEDMSDLGQPIDDDLEGPASTGPRRVSIWPHVEERVVDLVSAHRSTIVFANSRRLAERLTARLNEIAAERAGLAPAEIGAPPAEIMAQSGQSDGAPPVIARAHHGSVSKEQRALIEDDLKRGRLPCVVATSSLELGIDMGAVDLVIQIESPPSVASALQRVGRAGHQVGEVSRGVLFPKHRGDLAQTAVAVERMRSGAIESLSVPANPLDVLAQQVVAATALDAWDVETLFDVVRRSAPFASLPRSAYDATLDLLSGRYPSDEFAELRPRLVWDRVTGQLTGRPGAQRLAVTSGGTIPDRGLFGVFLVGGDGPGKRVGELDEEMVYESRVGDVFALGATSWRIEDITHDRVLVTPAPGVPGRLPFWKGDTLGRPAELGEAVGAFTRELGAMKPEAAVERARANGLDEWAADNLVSYLTEQREATDILPSDRTIVVERFHDELGDWRLVVHSPYGTPVHAPWALAINTRLRERYGVEASAVASDDGIVLRIPDADQDPPGGEVVVFEAEEIEQIVTAEVGGSALFASRFRECAARALLLPRRDPGRRSPLWQQRQRSAQLLEVATKYPSFPIVLEAVREVVQDVYDVPSLVGLMQKLDRREVRVVDVSTTQPSPYARSLLFGYVAQFVYEGDSPIAERRAAALQLDQGLLAELLGRAELRELLDPEVLTEVEAELQRLAPDRRARDAEGVADLLRLLGPLTTAQVAERCVPDGDAAAWLTGLADVRRAVEVRLAGASALGRRRGRRPAARRARGPGPARHPRCLHRPRRRPAGRPGLPLRAHPRTVHHRRRRRGLRARRRGRPADAAAAGRRRPGAGGRVPARRLRQRVVRRRGAPQAPPPLAGPAPQGGRAGRAGGAGPVPAAVAARHRRSPRQPPRRRRRAVRGRAAGRLPGARLGAGAAGAGRAGQRLRAGDARRAHRLRRGRLGRSRHPARLRRLGQPAPRRPGAAHPPRARRDRPVPAAHLGDGGTRPRRCLVLPAARDRDRVHRRPGPLGRPVGAGVVGPGQQRHPRPVAGAHPVGVDDPSESAYTPAGAGLPAPSRQRVPRRCPGARRAAGVVGPLGAAAGARRRPDPPGARDRRGAARAARRGDPRRGGQRARDRWLRRRLQGALDVRGVRALPPRLLRERPGCRAVRHRRRDRPAAHVHRARARAPSPRRSRSPRPTRRTRTARRCRGRSAPRPIPRPSRPARAARGTAPAARPARWWCWSTARCRCTSSAAAAPC